MTSSKTNTPVDMASTSRADRVKMETVRLRRFIGLATVSASRDTVSVARPRTMTWPGRAGTG